MRKFFDPIQVTDRSTALDEHFAQDKKLRTKRRRKADKDAARAAKLAEQQLHPEEQTLGIITQNVNGLGATEKERSNWFTAFGTSDSHGNSDVLLLQETHVAAGEMEAYKILLAMR